MIKWFLLAFMSAIFSGIAAIFEKKTLFLEKPLSFSTTLAILNLVLAIPFFFLTDFSTITIQKLGVLFFKSILGAGASLLVMKSIKKLELSAALPLLILTPGLVAIFAFIFLKENLSNIEIIGMVLLLSGTYLLQTRKNQKIFDPFKSLIKTKAYLWIIGALVLFTITSILDKALLKNFNLPLNPFMAFQHLFLAIIFTIMILFSKEKNEIAFLIKRSSKFILIVSILTIFYRYTQLQAVKNAPVALVLSLKRFSVLIAVIIGGKLFKEKRLIKKIIATIIMFVGAVLIING